MNKFITAAAITLALLLPIPAIAGSCAGGANSWEEGRVLFEEKVKDVFVYVGSKEFPDKSIVVVYRDVTKPDIFFGMLFDPNHCFVASRALTAGEVADLGIASI